MNQMRELFEKWAKSECLDTDSVDGFYSDNDTHIAWGSWQAAQSAAVPVVGDVVGWLCKHGGSSWFTESESRRDIHIDAGWDVTPLIIQPATSITADELERLQRNDARYMWLRDLKNDETAVRLLKAECDTELDEAIDAAIAGEKK